VPTLKLTEIDYNRANSVSQSDKHMPNPQIFIVLPAYNAEKTLERTLAEIPSEYREHIILVDDC